MTLQKKLPLFLTLGMFGCNAQQATTPNSSAATAVSKSAKTQAAIKQIVTQMGDLDQISSASKDVCPAASTKAGVARCLSKVRLNKRGEAYQAAGPSSGLGATVLQIAYNVQTGGGSGVTVAIVDAYDNPNVESDLAVYRAQYGLPACTTANGCFSKVGQTGTSSLPAADTTGWSIEMALDVDMASAACPSCKILVVETNSESMADLGAGVDTAVTLGAKAVSNSYGGAEDATVSSAESDYTHAGVSIMASSGDSLYGASYPATGAGVIAVGGTSLTQDSSTRGWTESVWNSNGGGTGSGCSAFIAKPSWQNDPSCTFRMEADTSADADPSTGPAIYDTYTNSDGINGWVVVGGTSASSPFVAGLFASSGIAGVDASYVYSHTAGFNDVTSGNNASGGSYMCTGGVGYDGPTGWGSPNGAVLANAGGAAAQPAPPAATGSCAGGGGGSGGSCDHSICTVGDPLDPSCSPDAEIICSFDSGCCTSSWDEICAGIAQLLFSSDC